LISEQVKQFANAYLWCFQWNGEINMMGKKDDIVDTNWVPKWLGGINQKCSSEVCLTLASNRSVCSYNLTACCMQYLTCGRRWQGQGDAWSIGWKFN